MASLRSQGAKAGTLTPPTRNERNAPAVAAPNGSKNVKERKIRRSLEFDLERPEVFDITDGDAAEQAHAKIGGNTPSSTSTKGSTRSDVAEKSGAGDQSALHDAVQQYGSSVEIDAWNLESWDSPSSVAAQASPGSCQDLESPIKEIADAVRQDVQAGLEVLADSSTSQMRCWLSEEVAFVRHDMQQLVSNMVNKSMDVFVEDVKKQMQELRDVQCSMCERFTLLQTKFDNHTQHSEECQVGTANCPREFAKPNSAEEARMLGEERRWRIKIDAVEEEVNKCTQTVDAFAKRSADLSEQVDKRLGSLTESVTSLTERLIEDEAEISQCIKYLGEVSTAQETLSKHGEVLNQQSCELRFAADAVVTLENNFSKLELERLQDLHKVLDKFEIQNKQTKSISKEVDAGWTRCLAALREEMAKKLETKADRSSVKDALSKRDERLTEVTGQLSQLCSGDGRIANQMKELRRFAKALGSRDARIDQIKADLSQKADAVDVQKTTTTLQSWVEDVREAIGVWSQQAHQSSVREFEHALSTLQKHDTMLSNVWEWCQKVRVREQGLTHVLMHMVERSSPDQLKFIEESLRVPVLEQTA